MTGRRRTGYNQRQSIAHQQDDPHLLAGWGRLLQSYTLPVFPQKTCPCLATWPKEAPPHWEPPADAERLCMGHFRSVGTGLQYVYERNLRQLPDSCVFDRLRDHSRRRWTDVDRGCQFGENRERLIRRAVRKVLLPVRFYFTNRDLLCSCIDARSDHG